MTPSDASRSPSLPLICRSPTSRVFFHPCVWSRTVDALSPLALLTLSKQRRTARPNHPPHRTSNALFHPVFLTRWLARANLKCRMHSVFHLYSVSWMHLRCVKMLVCLKMLPGISERPVSLLAASLWKDAFPPSDALPTRPVAPKATRAGIFSAALVFEKFQNKKCSHLKTKNMRSNNIVSDKESHC